MELDPPLIYTEHMDSQKVHNDGKKYENKVLKAIRELYPLSKVEVNQFRPGRISGSKGRQIDILLTHENQQIDIDAKDYGRHIDMNVVAEYAFKLQDEDITQGIMVANSPYAATALSTAKHFGIKPTHLVDTADPENKFNLFQKTLIEETSLGNVHIGIKHKSLQPINLPPDLRQLILISEDGTQTTAYETFRSLWNDNKCPDSEGDHQIVLANQSIITWEGNVVTVNELTYTYPVKKVYRHGKWEIEETMGLYDAAQESFSTHSMKSTMMSTSEIDGWDVISKDEANKHSYGMKFITKRLLPDEEQIKEE